MKNKLLKSFFAILLIPVLFLAGCKKADPLPAIDLATYLNSEMTVSYYQLEAKSTKDVSFITDTKFDEEKLGKYVKFELTANTVWMYKMYVESISFYVYTTASSTSEMIVNVSMTNMADEESLKKTSSEEPPTETASEQCTFIPEKGKATKCTFNIGKTVAKATGATITIDILNSLELFDTDNGQADFQWVIYGFEIHGESRAYSKK